MQNIWSYGILGLLAIALLFGLAMMLGRHLKNRSNETVACEEFSDWHKPFE